MLIVRAARQAIECPNMHPFQTCFIGNIGTNGINVGIDGSKSIIIEFKRMPHWNDIQQQCPIYRDENNSCVVNAGIHALPSSQYTIDSLF